MRLLKSWLRGDATSVGNRSRAESSLSCSISCLGCTRPRVVLVRAEREQHKQTTARATQLERELHGREQRVRELEAEKENVRSGLVCARHLTWHVTRIHWRYSLTSKCTLVATCTRTRTLSLQSTLGVSLL